MSDDVEKLIERLKRDAYRNFCDGLDERRDTCEQAIEALRALLAERAYYKSRAADLGQQKIDQATIASLLADNELLRNEVAKRETSGVWLRLQEALARAEKAEAELVELKSHFHGKYHINSYGDGARAQHARDEAEIARLREALVEVADPCRNRGSRVIARSALGEKP